VIAATIARRFSTPGVSPYDEVEWSGRDIVLTNSATGAVIFEQRGVEFPTSWSQTAATIVTQKYFRGQLRTPEREYSLRQLLDRVVDTIAQWGAEGGYFDTAADASTFADELRWLLLHQRGAFNSPVWFNLGVPGVVPQTSACFILSVDDTIESILNWYVEEGMIFRGGSGAGVNLSRIRASHEQLSGGGTPSGPVSFMRGADASAGTIKSGGKTRRAAKMVILDIDHPDVEEFIWTKAREERKAHALRAAGFDMDLDGVDSHSIQYQNANNSVRLTDEFMAAVEADASWDLISRTTGEVLATRPARELFHQIAAAAWECADPGVQFDTTINSWHTCPASGRINASNPCSEYLHVDDSACNLASLNLLAFADAEGRFQVDDFVAAVATFITAQEILVTRSHYPTERIAANARAFRQLGLGYTNLGALLMTNGLPYDSVEGRALAAAVTAVLCGAAYRTSAELATRLGPFDAYEPNAAATLAVIDRHRRAVDQIEGLASVPAELTAAATSLWDQAHGLATRHGVRNAQVTNLAPTGTISFLMDADTTGVEPDLALLKTKKLVGGGSMRLVNRSVATALARLGYREDQVLSIVAHVDEHATIAGAPGLKPEHLGVFACSMGDNTIAPLGHVKMMAAVQPFLSGAISKTANLPETATVADIEELYRTAWRLGVKALAVYRDNCKVAQPLTAGSGTTPDAGTAADPITAATEAVLADLAVARPVRERLPRDRRSRTFEFRVADCKGFVTVGEYDDGRPGEIFVRVSKQGSTLAGIMDAFAIAVSHGLQYGVPLDAYVRAFVGMRFEPAGMTDDPDLRIASSLIDYLFRRLAVLYLPAEQRAELNIFTTHERRQPTLPGVEEAVTPTSTGAELVPDPPSHRPAGPPAAPLATPRTGARNDAPLCMDCGSQMVRAGSCYACTTCGNTSGCS
jgi:ribonucleoside-diphosphate reductase alpha chain